MILHTANIRRLKLMQPTETAYMLAEGQRLADRTWTPLHRVSSSVLWVFLYGEDRFFQMHKGVTLAGLTRSWRAITQSERYIWPGGSSISMQLARNLYLSPDKTFSRKAQEIGLAIQMEMLLSKARIYELYLHTIEMGPGIWGIGEGSQHYCLKLASTVNIAEAIMMACLLGAPKKPCTGGNLCRIHAKYWQIAGALWRNRLLDKQQFLRLNVLGSLILERLRSTSSVVYALQVCHDETALEINRTPF